MGVWLVWLILAVVLGVAEILTLTAVLGILSAAASWRRKPRHCCNTTVMGCWIIISTTGRGSSVSNQ